MIILIALGSALMIAVVNVLLKKLYQTASSRELAPLNFLQIVIIMTLFMPFFYYFKPSGYVIALMLIICILDSLANYFYFKSIEYGEVSYVSIFMSLSPVFTLLIFTALVDFISIRTLIGILGIIFSIYFLNLNDKKNLLEPFLNLTKNKNYYGIINAFLVGSSAVLIKLLFSTNAINPPTFFTLRCAFVFLAMLIILKPRWSLITKQIVIDSSIRSLFVIGNFLLYLYAVNFGNVVVAATLVNTYPIFVIILSYIMFKEKITAKKFSAILSVLFFIFILSYTS